jgi:DNA-binding CsgD family transcriptional regulator
VVESLAPALCVASDWVGADWPRLYLEVGHRMDPCLGALRESPRVRYTADLLGSREAFELATTLAGPEELYRYGVIGPLVSETSLIGAVRLAWVGPPPASALEHVATMCAHASVRLAQIGYPPAPPPPGFARLTDRQREVAGLVARGLTNAEVGTALCISAEAVKKHVGHLLAALEVANRTELAALIARAQPRLDLGTPVLPGVHVTGTPRPAMLRRLRV